MSRAYTDKEVRDMFIENLKGLADALGGFLFSLLNLFDGCTDLPAFDLVVRPHPNDKDYLQKLGENYFEDGMVINDCMMHEEYKT